MRSSSSATQRSFESAPDFYLTTAGKNDSLASPRACWRKARLADDSRDDYLLVEIDPPLIGQKYGLGAEDIGHLLLSSKFESFSLFPVDHWPCPVYVTRILDDSILDTLTLTGDQVEMIAWGEIFLTLEEARAVAERFTR